MVAKLAKIAVLLMFLLGIIVAPLWIMVELGNSVAPGADWVWYAALALTAVPAVLFLVA